MTAPVQEPTQGRTDSAQGFATRQLFRRPAPASGGGALDYAFCTKEDVVMAATSLTVASYTTGTAYGTSLTIDGSNRIEIAETGVFLFVVSVVFPSAATESWNARITPPAVPAATGTLNPDSGVWSAVSAATAGSPQSFGVWAVKDTLLIAVADVTGGPFLVNVDLNKSNATSRLVDVGLYGVRLGAPHTS